MRNQIAFVGRLENKDKNISFIKDIQLELNKRSINISIDIYGDGPDKKIVENIPNLKLNGVFKEEQLNEILSKVKILILPSFYEGFSFSIVEALSNGIPCIIANTFTNAKFLIDDNRGKLIDNFDTDTWIKEICNIYFNDEKYLILSSNAIKFSKEYLSKDIFEYKWLQLLT